MPQEKDAPKKFPLIAVVIGISAVAILGFGGYVAYTIFSQEGIGDQGAVQERKINVTDWDASLFKKPAFENLKVKTAEPLEAGTTGNPAPFERPTE